MKTGEQIHNEDGYLIFTSDNLHKVGDSIPNLIQMDLSERTVNQPFSITRIATKDEYTDQMLKHGAVKGRIWYNKYFYEARTD